MMIRVGCRLSYQMEANTPMIALLNVHFSRAGDMARPDHLVSDPMVPVSMYRDDFGNWCTRLVAPQGAFTLSTGGLVRDDGMPDPLASWATQHAVEDLPAEAMVYLLGSRYCETDRMSEFAWQTFSGTPPGWARVQAICDFAHNHVKFGYEHSDPTQTAMQTFERGTGVCRDYTHLAVTLCRCMNIPTRYCTGYLSDIGVPPPHGTMDFAAWMEVYLSGQWWTFDPRNNQPMRGRILVARGRDATDVPLTQTFGANTLTGFEVTCEEP